MLSPIMSSWPAGDNIAIGGTTVNQLAVGGVTVTNSPISTYRSLDSFTLTGMQVDDLVELHWGIELNIPAAMNPTFSWGVSAYGPGLAALNFVNYFDLTTGAPTQQGVTLNLGSDIFALYSLHGSSGPNDAPFYPYTVDRQKATAGGTVQTRTQMDLNTPELVKTSGQTPDTIPLIHIPTAGTWTFDFIYSCSTAGSFLMRDTIRFVRRLRFT